MDTHATFFLMIVMLLIGFIAGAYLSWTGMQEEAVKAGVATYVADKNTGESVFTWLKGCTESNPPATKE